MAIRRWLESQCACAEAMEWCGERSGRAAYEECERADWLLWALGRLVDRQMLVLAACACARRALQHVPKGEMRPLRAIETAERWSRGEATIRAVRAASAASKAAAKAADIAAVDSTDVAAWAAARAAAWVADTATEDSAETAAWAAAEAPARVARASAGAAAEHKAMCRIIREMIHFDERWNDK